MLASIITASTLGAAAVLAAPVYPDLNLNAAMPGSVDVVSDYFNLLAQKVQESRWMSTAPVCDLTKAKLPATCELSQLTSYLLYSVSSVRPLLTSFLACQHPPRSRHRRLA